MGKGQNTIVVAMTAALALWMPRTGLAQSQAGGVPALDARVSALEAANSSLQAALAAEAAARQAADTALSEAIGAEAAARSAADGTLNNGIVAEAAERQARDAALRNVIDQLQRAVASVGAAYWAQDDTPVGIISDLNSHDILRLGLPAESTC